MAETSKVLDVAVQVDDEIASPSRRPHRLALAKAGPVHDDSAMTMRLEGSAVAGTIIDDEDLVDEPDGLEQAVVDARHDGADRPRLVAGGDAHDDA